MDIQALKARVDIVSVVAVYRKLTKQGDEYVASCVWHSPDATPSMSVIPAKRFAYCHACGCHGDIIDIVAACEGLGKADAIRRLEQTTYAEPEFVPSRRKRLTDQPRETAKPPPGKEPDFRIDKLGGDPRFIFAVRDLDGGVLGYEAIYYVDGRKEPRVWTWGRRGNLPFEWGMGQFQGLRPLFGLQHLRNKPRAPVIVSEGPKKALAIEILLPMYASLSILGGCRAIGKHDWSVLAGRRVIIWPDADEPGMNMARDLAMVLTDPDGLGLDVRIIEPHGQRDGWDAADALSDGWTTEQTIEWARQRIVRYE